MLYSRLITVPQTHAKRLPTRVTHLSGRLQHNALADDNKSSEEKRIKPRYFWPASSLPPWESLKCDKIERL